MAVGCAGTVGYLSSRLVHRTADDLGDPVVLLAAFYLLLAIVNRSTALSVNLYRRCGPEGGRSFCHIGDKRAQKTVRQPFCPATQQN
jgi:hypothetical protein